MKIRILAIALLGLAAGAAQGQQAWTFGQVLQAALDSHPAMLGSRSAREAARAEREGAEWQRYPTPTIEANTGDSGGGHGAARIDQPLWTGGRITAGINAAASRFDAATSAIDETRLDLTLRVVAAASEALRQKARLRHAESGVREHERLLGMIERRVAQEVSSQTDQRLAESRLFQARNELSLAKQSYGNARLQLAQLAGRPVEDIAPAGMERLEAPPGQDAALEQALAWSPTLRRLAHEEEAAGAEIDSRRSAYLPQLALRLERTTGQFGDSRALLVLQAQPGAGLSARSGVEGAVARREAAGLARETARRDVAERIALDWNEWMAARGRLENAEASRTMSTEVFESYTRQYVIGRKTWIDVLNAVREATQAEFALEDARAQAIAAGLRLRARTGTLDLG